MDRGPWMGVGHSQWLVYTTVYIERFSVIRAAKVAVNNGNSRPTFF